MLAILQPIGQADDHMPPVAYPLQNTLPFLALLAARCAIVLAERGRRFGRAVLWPARIVFLLTLLASEYAFVFGSALLAGECVAAWAKRRQAGASAPAAVLATACERRFLYDAASVFLALAVCPSLRLD